MATRGPLDGVVSILETPILDERKWSKVPSIPAHAVLLDLEDSVPPERKAEARAKVCACLDEGSFFPGKVPIPRSNGLGTPWGLDDVRALAARGVSLLAYPKARTADELVELRRRLHDGGADPGIVVIVETARAVIELESIARVDGVVGFVLGPSDLSVDAGWSLFADGRVSAEAYAYPKSKLVLVGAAYDIPVYDTVFVPDLRDESQVRACAAHARALGFAGMATFYPPHVAVVNDAFTPSREEVEAARKIVALYEEALARGAAAVQEGGKALIVQDYKRAQRVLARRGRQ
jgi:citrate lyase beta subunit